ncbi:MAG: McrC family protein [Muribaculaceae bacterium]|nr:McrC family protein [Muribaculaceae bacterium]
MSLIQIQDYDRNENEILDAEDIKNLRLVANTELKQLLSDNNTHLLVFPPRIGGNFDGIDDKYIIKLRESNNKAYIKAEDVLGYVGIGNTFLSIGTRFTGNAKEDFLLHYMLQKVLRINIFKYDHPSTNDAVLDILALMFPGMLSKALRQGLLKRYVRVERNDANIKGTININQHIRYNQPFNGKIAYTQREHTANNNAIQLIRHTIEYIKTTPVKQILKNSSEVKDNIAVIEFATPNYEKRNRQLIINKNKRRNPHPYFTAYDPLLNLCIAILEHHKVRYTSQDKLIYGILFSGSWLWEEYLYSAIFSKLNFTHPDNRRKTDAIYIFKGKIDNSSADPDIIEKNSAPRFPDYMYEEKGIVKIVVDAKYRHHSYCGDRDNLHQLLTYMYITKSQSGAFIYPIGSNDDLELMNEPPKAIEGYGGDYNRFGFVIPRDASNYSEFEKNMCKEEDRLKDRIKELLKH